MSSDEILDLALVTELREIMAEGFVALVESYQRDTEGKLAQMREALASGEHVSLRQLAHSLKGSSSNLGALHVAAACLALEQAAESADNVAQAAALDQATEAAQQAFQALQQIG